MSEQESTLDDFTDTSTTENEKSEQRESRFWGIVPEGWKLVAGNEVYEVNPNPKPTEEPNTYIEMDALDTVLPWPKYFGKRNASEYSGKTFTEGDTLFARITPCTENGKAAFVPEMETEVGIGSTEYAVLSPKADRIHPWLLYYLSKSHPVYNYAVSRMRGSTGRQRVPFSVFRRELDIALPSLSEQRMIASVLYGVDQTIENTDKIITQQQKIKMGLLRSLYTEGYLDHAQFEQARLVAKEFSFPINWELTRLDTIVESSIIDFGSFSSTKLVEYVEEGVPFLRSDMFSDEGLKEEKLKYIPQSVHEKLEKSHVYPGDILFTKIGVNLGKSALYDGKYGVCNSNATVAKIRADTNTINKKYLMYFLQSFVCESQYRPKVVGTPPRINLSDIRSMKVPIPSDKEQALIAKTIESMDDAILNNREQKKELERLKQGLMQDLLSGTVRTTDTNIQVPDEVAQHG